VKVNTVRLGGSKTSLINFLFQLPVNPTTVGANTVTVTRSDGKTITGTTAVDAGSNNQSVTWTPTTTPNLFGAVYTVKVTGVKVGPNVGPLSTTPFTDYNMSFTTRQFTVKGIYSGGTKVDGTKNMPPESLINGAWNVQYLDLADPATVTESNVQATSGGAAAPATVTDSGDHTKFNLKLKDTATAIKFKTQYLVTSSGAIKEATAAQGGVSESTGQALRVEGCNSTDCSDARGFYTRAFTASITTAPNLTGPNTGNFTIHFNYPIDPATYTGNSGVVYSLVPGTFDLDHGFQPTGSGKITLNCTLQGNNQDIRCTPATAPALNTYYRAIATLAGVKVATPFTSGPTSVPLDTATGTFNGTLTQTYLTACP
jgi:hypothetical protein